MALWKDPTKHSPANPAASKPARFEVPETEPVPGFLASSGTATHAPRDDEPRSESVIAPDIVIEGKIEGSGHVRIAGRFKGDITVQGDLSIDSGAHVTGSVRADKVHIAGELVGNIESATHVELLQSGSLTGDLKAKSLVVAAGSRMRGQADFGWDDTGAGKSVKKTADGYGADQPATVGT